MGDLDAALNDFAGKTINIRINKGGKTGTKPVAVKAGDTKEAAQTAFEDMFRSALTSDHEEIRELAANIDRNEADIEIKRSEMRELRTRAKQNYQALIIAAKVGNAENAKEAARVKDEIDADIDSHKSDIRELGAHVKDDRRALSKSIEQLF